MPHSPLIMIIRHGEKPTEALKGISQDGAESEHSLIIRGWQRAGALTAFFGPGRIERVGKKLAQPVVLFATSPDAAGAESGDQSRREEETLQALSEVLAVELNLSFGKGQESEVAAAAIASDGPVLIAWDHRKIVALAKVIAFADDIPEEWPSERFDMIFAFHLQPDGSYSFSQVPQLLLAGDTEQPIPVSSTRQAVSQGH